MRAFALQPAMSELVEHKNGALRCFLEHTEDQPGSDRKGVVDPD